MWAHYELRCEGVYGLTGRTLATAKRWAMNSIPGISRLLIGYGFLAGELYVLTASEKDIVVFVSESTK